MTMSRKWRRIGGKNPPLLDRTPVILAIPRPDCLDAPWAQGEAYYYNDDDGHYEGWWWANTDPGDYYAEKLEITYGSDTSDWLWQPMPKLPKAKR